MGQTVFLELYFITMNIDHGVKSVSISLSKDHHVWSSYLEKLLCNSLLHYKYDYQRKHVQIKYQLQFTLNYIQSLRQKSARLFIVENQEPRFNALNLVNVLGENFKLLKSSMTIKNPLGKIEKKERGWYRHVCSETTERKKRLHEKFYGCVSYHIEHTWNFTLDKQLRLNVTFDLVSIVFSNMYSCRSNVGNITVKNGRNDVSCLYCGVLANISCFPKGRNLGIFLYVKQYVKYNILFSYSVMDMSILYSYHNTTWNKDINGVQKLFNRGIYLFAGEKYIDEYLISTDQAKTIVFTINKTQLFVVHDGPGQACSKLRHFENKYYTKSFIAFIIYTRHYKESNATVIYESNQSVIYITLEINKTLDLNYSSVCAQKLQICTIYIVTTLNLNLVITTVNMTYCGLENTQCYFAGFVAYKRTRWQSLKHVSTVCALQNIKIEYKPIYIDSKSGFLIFYAFKEYGNLHMSLRITTIQCKLIPINICALAEHCYSMFCKRHQYRLNQNWIKKVRQFRSGLLSLNLRYSTCVNIEVVSDMHNVPFWQRTHSSISFCKLRIELIYFIRTLPLNYVITGALSGKDVFQSTAIPLYMVKSLSFIT